MLRLFPKKWFKCSKCGGIWKKGSTDEECAEEYKESFPNDPNREWPIEVICDDCYKELKPWLDELTPEERGVIEQEGLDELEIELHDKDISLEKIERKWFKKWRKEYPEDLKKLEKSFETSEEFEEDLEKITKIFAEKFMDHKYGHRLTIPKEEDKGVFGKLSEIEP
ncbi:hypothetical protein LCGC14_1020160 [marine sediment metagenome]|uniref:Uncharacterized protein n=1 Tax=marine sediment metagenome TaxID=412755 RepID=A0A0F9NJ98_9ZZZZ